MSTHEQVETPHGEGWFLRAAAFVGDLGNPFYREERQRDVWNEASAVGFQLALWLGLAAATAMVWFGGQPALPYAVTLLVVVGLPALISVAYAWRLGVRAEDPSRMLGLRSAPYAVLLALFVVGAGRVAREDSFTGGFASGLGAGSALALLGLVLRGARARRRAR